MGEMSCSDWVRTAAIGASRLHWEDWVGAAAREGRALRARYGLRRGIDAAMCSRSRWSRPETGWPGTGIYGVGCSDSLA